MAISKIIKYHLEDEVQQLKADYEKKIKDIVGLGYMVGSIPPVPVRAFGYVYIFPACFNGILIFVIRVFSDKLSEEISCLRKVIPCKVIFVVTYPPGQSLFNSSLGGCFSRKSQTLTVSMVSSSDRAL